MTHQLIEGMGYMAYTEYNFFNRIFEIGFYNGNVFHYFDVPEEVYAQFGKAENQESFFSENIKDKFKSLSVVKA